MSEEESSVLFSLKELMSIEEDRIKTEEDDRVRLAQEAERLRLETERRAREAEDARIRAEEERRRVEEQRRREEQARLAAIQQGELEKARTEAEQRARLEAMTAQQAHERQLAQLKQDKGKKQLQTFLIVGACVVVLGGGIGGYFAWKNVQEKEAALAAQQAEAKRLKEEAEAERMRRQQEIDDLKGSLAKLEGDSEEAKKLREKIAQLEQDKDTDKPAPGNRGGRPSTGSGGKTDAPAPTPKPACREGDPMCSDIGG
jgi:colicin import membrane protein